AYAQTGNMAQVARELDLSPDTVRGWVRARQDELAELRTFHQAQPILRLYEQAGQVLDKAAAAPVGSVRVGAVAVGVLIDKILLLSGQATARTENMVSRDDGAAAR